MSDDDAPAAADAPEPDEAEQPPYRRDVNPQDRFSVSGKPLPREEMIASTMGDLHGRPPVEPRPQPEPMPFEVIWRARRPAPNPAEAEWVPPPPPDDPPLDEPVPDDPDDD